MKRDAFVHARWFPGEKSAPPLEMFCSATAAAPAVRGSAPSTPDRRYNASPYTNNQRCPSAKFMEREAAPLSRTDVVDSSATGVDDPSAVSGANQTRVGPEYVCPAASHTLPAPSVAHCELGVCAKDNPANLVHVVDPFARTMTAVGPQLKHAALKSDDEETKPSGDIKPSPPVPHMQLSGKPRRTADCTVAPVAPESSTTRAAPDDDARARMFPGPKGSSDCARAPRGSAATSSSASATAASDSGKPRRAPLRPLPRRDALAGWLHGSISVFTWGEERVRACAASAGK
jgi:hypothetical protein